MFGFEWCNFLIFTFHYALFFTLCPFFALYFSVGPDFFSSSVLINVMLWMVKFPIAFFVRSSWFFLSLSLSGVLSWFRKLHKQHTALPSIFGVCVCEWVRAFSLFFFLFPFFIFKWPTFCCNVSLICSLHCNIIKFWIVVGFFCDCVYALVFITNCKTAAFSIHSNWFAFQLLFDRTDCFLSSEFSYRDTAEVVCVCVCITIHRDERTKKGSILIHKSKLMFNNEIKSLPENYFDTK